MIVALFRDAPGAHHSVLDSAPVVDAMKAGMMQAPNSPVFNDAPLYIKEALTFPYGYGMEFVRQVLFERGRQIAFTGAMRDPPTNTHQVMHPKVYLKGESSPAMFLPKLAPIFDKNYESYDKGSMGEFDVMVYLNQFVNEKVSQKLAPEWRGGVYHVAVNKSDAEVKTDDPSALDPKQVALLYWSRWSSPDVARKFADAYASSLYKRYKFAQGLEPPKAGEITAPVTRWQTDQGLVSVQQRGEYVLALESFDEATTAKLQEAIFASVEPGSAEAK